MPHHLLHSSQHHNFQTNPQQWTLLISACHSDDLLCSFIGFSFVCDSDVGGVWQLAVHPPLPRLHPSDIGQCQPQQKTPFLVPLLLSAPSALPIHRNHHNNTGIAQGPPPQHLRYRPRLPSGSPLRLGHRRPVHSSLRTEEVRAPKDLPSLLVHPELRL